MKGSDVGWVKRHEGMDEQKCVLAAMRLKRRCLQMPTGNYFGAPTPYVGARLVDRRPNAFGALDVDDSRSH
jgi:hypothetical protein